MSRRVLVTDIAWPDTSVEESVLAPAGIECTLAPDGDETTLVDLAGDVDGILTCFASVTRPVIAASPKLAVIARTGVGLDNIDVGAATERGITVTRVPDYCVDEVSEHTVALALMLLRRIPVYADSARGGVWGVQPDVPIHRISGRRAMVLGRGRIGTAVAEKLRGLGVSVVDSPDGADLLSVHVPLTEATRNLIDADYLGRLAPGAVLVNTSRGSVVDSAAVLAAVESGHLAGVGLDVLPVEPAAVDDPLVRHPNVVITPHVAFYSQESLRDLRTRAARSVVEVLEGRSR